MSCKKDKRMCFCSECNNNRYDLLEQLKGVNNDHPSLEHFRQGCKCEGCHKMWNEYQRQYQAKKKEGYSKHVELKDAIHPSAQHYRHGCRCQGCKDVMAAYNQERRKARKTLSDFLKNE